MNLKVSDEQVEEMQSLLSDGWMGEGANDIRNFLADRETMLAQIKELEAEVKRLQRKIFDIEIEWFKGSD